MLHKEFKRARREWNRIADEDDASILAQWSLEYARPLINEITRLREELKQRNKKKRQVHARLAAEQDDHDDLIDEIENLRDWIAGAPGDTSLPEVIVGRLDRILEPYKEDEHD